MADRSDASLVLRADAGAEIGSGHLVRCLALAEAWQARGGQAVLASRSPDTSIIKPAVAKGIRVRELTENPGSDQDAEAVIDLADEVDASWIVLDGYAFGPSYQNKISVAYPTMLIDDFATTGAGQIDLVLDQNLAAQEGTYQGQAFGGEVLTGPDYALLRPQFQQRAGSRTPIPDRARNCLITLGGSSSTDSITTVIEGALAANVPSLEITVASGWHDGRKDALDPYRERRGLTILGEVQEMAGLMVRADMAVSGAGSTSWEMACIGLPALQLILSEDQAGNARALDRAKINRNLGPIRELTPKAVQNGIEMLAHDASARRSMSKRGQSLVDGRGAKRVADYMLEMRM